MANCLFYLNDGSSHIRMNSSVDLFAMNDATCTDPADTDTIYTNCRFLLNDSASLFLLNSGVDILLMNDQSCIDFSNVREVGSSISAGRFVKGRWVPIPMGPKGQYTKKAFGSLIDDLRAEHDAKMAAMEEERLRLLAEKEARIARFKADKAARIAAIKAGKK